MENQSKWGLREAFSNTIHGTLSFLTAVIQFAIIIGLIWLLNFGVNQIFGEETAEQTETSIETPQRVNAGGGLWHNPDGI